MVTDSVLPGTIVPPTPGVSGGDVGNDGILGVGETWTVDVAGTFTLGDNLNVGTATADYTDSQGNSPDPGLSDSDPANYFGALVSIDIQKKTNGVDVVDNDDPNMPQIAPERSRELHL